MNRELEKGSVVLWSLTMVTNACNYLFQMISSRVLSVPDFGMLNFLFSLIVVFTVPCLVLSMVMAKYLAMLTQAEDWDGITVFVKGMTQKISWLVVFWTILGIVVLLIVGQQLDRPLLFFCVVLAVGFTYFLYLYMGIAQGKQAFLIMPLIPFVLAFVKVIGSVFALCVDSGSRLYLILDMTVLGTVIGAAFGYYLLQKKYHELSLAKMRDTPLYAISSFSKTYVVSVLVANLCFVFMMNVDMLFAKIFAGDYVLGIYSTAMFFGRIIVYSVSALAGAMFPLIAKHSSDFVMSARTYRKALLYSMVVMVVFFIFLVLWKDMIIGILFGKRYLEGASYTLYACLFGVGVSLCQLNMNFMLAIDRTKVLIISYVLGCGMIMALFVRTYSGMNNVLKDLSIILFFVFVINLVYIGWLYRKERKRLTVVNRE